VRSTERQWQMLLTLRPARGNEVEVSLQYGEVKPDQDLPHTFCATMSSDMLKPRIEEPVGNALLRLVHEITPVLRGIKAREMLDKNQLLIQGEE
jgi:hypothetical protein